MAESSVLIVDDDRSIVRLCERVLERASFKTYATTDPYEAIKLMEVYKLDLLLSDIRMPVMDGFELISRAKKYHPHIAVLVMTGFGTIDTAIQALSRGVDGLILKPFSSTSDLVDAARRVLTTSREKLDAARLQALRPLFDVSEKIFSETNPQTLQVLIMNAVQDLYQSKCAGVFARQNGDFTLVMQRGVQEKEQTSAWHTLKNYMTGLSDPVLINASGPGDSDLQHLVRTMECASVLIVPVISERQRLVFFTTRDASKTGFSEPDLELFTILARQSAVALENSRLYTDLLNSLKQVEESQHALVQAEKMAAVGRLMASLAHEINNPLQAVRNCLHLASRADLEAGQRAHYLSMTDSELDRLVTTVRHMLDFYRPGKRDREYIELRTAVERVLHLLKTQLIHQGITCHLNIPEDCPPLFAVRDQIQQVFFNLVLNSMDAMESMTQNKAIWVDVAIDEKTLSIFVEDSGPGIPPEMQGNLFEPFSSSKPNGTGLGLAVSYGVIEAHGGILDQAQPRHGSGACFTIQLPIEKVA